MEKYYTLREIAELLRVDKKTVYHWIKIGKLSAIQLGKWSHYRISESTISNLGKKEGETA